MRCVFIHNFFMLRLLIHFLRSSDEILIHAYAHVDPFTNIPDI